MTTYSSWQRFRDSSTGSRPPISSLATGAISTRHGPGWTSSYGRKKLADGTLTLVASQNRFEENTIPIYEQIYALAGLSQYFRITGDMEVLDDIKRTIRAFDTFFLANGQPEPHNGVLQPYRPRNHELRHR